MFSVDYDCELISPATEEVKCMFFQDSVNIIYSFLGYFEMVVVVFCLYIIVYKILWCWVAKKFFIV